MHLLPWRRRKSSLWKQNEPSVTQSLGTSLLTWTEGLDYVGDGARIVKQANVKDRESNFNKIKITLGPIHKHIGLTVALASLNDFPKITS